MSDSDGEEFSNKSESETGSGSDSESIMEDGIDKKP